MITDYEQSVQRNLEGLKYVSTGVCPGCDQCKDIFGILEPCTNCQKGYVYIRPWGWRECPLCEGEGRRLTMVRFEEQWQTGQVFDEGSFSWSGCGICGSTLGGNRYTWHYVDDEGNICHEDDACTNCVHYLANGELPDD